MYCENSESIRTIENNLQLFNLQLLHYGAFLHYFNNCQFYNQEKVKNYCELLCADWGNLHEDLKDLIRLKLNEAWEKELEYGSKTPTLSPFGYHQKYWYVVVKKILKKEL